MEFDKKRFWKFTTALRRKISDGRLFCTELFLTVWPYALHHRTAPLADSERGGGTRKPLCPFQEGATDYTYTSLFSPIRTAPVEFSSPAELTLRTLATTKAGRAGQVRSPEMSHLVEAWRQVKASIHRKPAVAAV